MPRSLSQSLTVRPAFTLAGLRFLWLLLLVQWVWRLGQAFSAPGWSADTIWASLLVYVTFLPAPLLYLFVQRILLEIACVILVGPDAPHPPPRPWVRALNRLVVLSPTFTARGLRIVWLVALVVWAVDVAGNMWSLLHLWGSGFGGQASPSGEFASHLQPFSWLGLQPIINTSAGAGSDRGGGSCIAGRHGTGRHGEKPIA